MTGSRRAGSTNDGNGLPRLFRQPIGDLMADAAPESTPPTRNPLLTLLDEMGMVHLSASLERMIVQAQQFVQENPDLMEKLRSAVPDAKANDAPEKDADVTVAFEQEFVVRDDKGETQAVLYYEENDVEEAFQDEGPSVWIDSFSVAKDLRGKGVGNKIMRTFLERYATTHTIFLRVRPFNDAPMTREQLTQFYANWGFVTLMVPTVMVRYPHSLRYKGEEL